MRAHDDNLYNEMTLLISIVNIISHGLIIIERFDWLTPMWQSQ